MAKVLALVSPGARDGDKVRKAIEQTVPEEHIEICDAFVDFSERLRRPLTQSPIVVLLAATKDDLAYLAPIQDLLEGLRTILLLPDEEQDTIAEGHKLHPHVVGYGEVFLAQLPAVLSRMLKD